MVPDLANVRHTSELTVLWYRLPELEVQRIAVLARRVERPDEERLGERWRAFLGAD